MPVSECGCLWLAFLSPTLKYLCSKASVEKRVLGLRIHLLTETRASKRSTGSAHSGQSPLRRPRPRERPGCSLTGKAVLMAAPRCTTAHSHPPCFLGQADLSQWTSPWGLSRALPTPSMPLSLHKPCPRQESQALPFCLTHRSRWRSRILGEAFPSSEAKPPR